MKGIVVSRHDKTAAVLIERKCFNRRYKKAVSCTKKMQVQDTIGLSLGDVVEIKRTRPISKSKCWTVVEKLGTKKIKMKRYDNCWQ